MLDALSTQKYFATQSYGVRKLTWCSGEIGQSCSTSIKCMLANSLPQVRKPGEAGAAAYRADLVVVDMAVLGAGWTGDDAWMSLDEWMALLETALEHGERHHDIERKFRLVFAMSQAPEVDESDLRHMQMEFTEFLEAVRWRMEQCCCCCCCKHSPLFLLPQLARVADIIGQAHAPTPLCLQLQQHVISKVLLLAHVETVS
mgnify:CR=1 FL=1